MQSYIIIPARLNSSRLPRKMLREINGRTIIQHTYLRAKECEAFVDDIIVATDSEEIKKSVEQVGGEVHMTGEQPNGTARVAQTVRDFNLEGIIVNWQGDYVNFLPQELHALTHLGHIEEDCVWTTYYCGGKEEFNNPSCVKVVVGDKLNCLYFSRAPIPYQSTHPFIHVGIYLYHSSLLNKILHSRKRKMYWLENENLEQLYWLANGYKIKAMLCNNSIGIDTEADLAAFENSLVCAKG